MEQMIITYGYILIFAGTFIEGETILILAGFLAHRGYLDIPLVILAAFLGSLLGDQVYFFLGRHRGAAVLARRPGWKAKIERVNRFLGTHSTLVILSFRFLYGLRTVAPFAIGMSGVPAPRFALLNALSALVWAVAVGGLGYLFGHTMETILGDMRKIEIALIAILLAVFLGIVLYRHYGRRNTIREDAQ